MDKESYFIAVASSDGIVVNSHFGKAGSFYIYKVNESESIRFHEKREVSPVCDGGNHNEEKLKENLLRFQDCRCILASRVGSSAADMAESLGIEIYEIPGLIEESIKQLIKYRKVIKLFD